MKKIFSYVLLLSMALTMVISVMPSQEVTSVRINNTQMEQISGGGDVLNCWAAGTLGLIGIGAVLSGGGVLFVAGLYGTATSYLALCSWG